MSRRNQALWSTVAAAVWVWLAVASSAQAILGETRTELDARYGMPDRIEGATVAYVKAGWIIRVVLGVDGRAWQVYYAKVGRVLILEGEQERLKRLNGRDWESRGLHDGMLCAEDADGALCATDLAGMTMAFLSADAAAEMAANPAKLPFE